MKSLFKKWVEVFTEAGFYLTAIITGISAQMNWLISLSWKPGETNFMDLFSETSWKHNSMTLRLLLSPILCIILFYLFRKTIVNFIDKKFGIDTRNIKKTINIPFYIFALSGMGFFGIYLDVSAIFSIFLLLEIILLIKYIPLKVLLPDIEDPSEIKKIFFLFFISGFAALIYQIIWQRMLFRTFGVNIESVTIIVSVFMLGLGTGSLFGGYLSKAFPDKSIKLFIFCELIIGIFGISSMSLIDYVTKITLHSPLWLMGLSTYALLFIPTTFMGATLPILVNYIHKRLNNVGESVSFLYFINTLGSAIASFITVFLLLYLTGLNFSILTAVFCNFVVVIVAAKIKIIPAKKTELTETQRAKEFPVNELGRGKYAMILLLSALTGFISLSHEIIWTNLISFLTGARSYVFGGLLGFFLFGIAFGANKARKISIQYSPDQVLLYIVKALAASSLIFYLLVPLNSWLNVYVVNDSPVFMFLSIMLISYLYGFIFPLLAHYATSAGEAVGVSVSRIYFANILGSAIGPLVIGFWLFEVTSFDNIMMIITVITMFTTVVAYYIIDSGKRDLSFQKKAAYIGVMLIILSSGPILYKGLFERLFYKRNYISGQQFSNVIENRSGIISTTPSGQGLADSIYGGGMYDGTFNIYPGKDKNNNSIDRAYKIPALHEKPAELLSIGLSGGAWVRVASLYPEIEKIDVVEINPGYLELINRYPDVSPILHDERIKFYIDDGRRWLLRNPEKKYDFILMNTTWHWRNQINNLVSREFLQLCKLHLKNNGVMYFNTTFSADIPYTAATVFKKVAVYKNFIAVTDGEFIQNPEIRARNLKKFSLNGQPVFNHSDPASMEAFDSLVMHSNESISEYERDLQKKYQLYLITDDNLASEFKTGKRIYNPEAAWKKLFERWFAS
jgi:spermidine synthase/MFS family permease